MREVIVDTSFGEVEGRVFGAREAALIATYKPPV
jgi:hypothetical protein